LSESELKFALSAAMPTSLQPRDLREWLVRKRDAQTKLRNYLNGASSFFSQGGTIREWNDQQRKLQDLRGKQAAGDSGAGGSITEEQRKRLESLRQKQRGR